MSVSHLQTPIKVTLFDETFTNSSDLEVDDGIEQLSKIMADGGKWLVKEGTTLGQKLEVYSAVPFLLEDEDSTVNWKFSKTSIHPLSWCNAVGFEKDASIILPALQKTRITANYFEGLAIDVPFSAKLKFTLDNGSKFVTLFSGIYNGVSSTKICVESRAVEERN